jgi:hypothetical protein
VYDDDTEIEPWDEGNAWRLEWELNGLLRERPESTSRRQRNEETWS